MMVWTSCTVVTSLLLLFISAWIAVSATEADGRDQRTFRLRREAAADDDGYVDYYDYGDYEDMDDDETGNDGEEDGGSTHKEKKRVEKKEERSGISGGSDDGYEDVYDETGDDGEEDDGSTHKEKERGEKKEERSAISGGSDDGYEDVYGQTGDDGEQDDATTQRETPKKTKKQQEEQQQEDEDDEEERTPQHNAEERKRGIQELQRKKKNRTRLSQKANDCKNGPIYDICTLLDDLEYYVESEVYFLKGDFDYELDQINTTYYKESLAGKERRIRKLEDEVALLREAQGDWVRQTASTNTSVSLGDVRLLLEKRDSESRSTRGRLLVYAGEDLGWGSVCDDLFYSDSATVACGQLGYNYGKLDGTRKTYTSEELVQIRKYPIVLDNVVCDRSRPNLLTCQHEPLGVHNCLLSEAVDLVCYNV